MKIQNLTRRGLMASGAAATFIATLGASKSVAWPRVGVSAPNTPANAAPIADYMFTEGNTAALGAAKRVIITNFVVAFQLDGMVRNNNETRIGNTTFGSGNAREVASKMTWANPDAAMMQEIADAGLAALKANFRAKGIEVLDEAVLAAQPAYASIIAANGLNNLEDFPILNNAEIARLGTTIGDTTSDGAKIVSARGLRPYTHSIFEGGQCCSVTKGFPSRQMYYVPGHEIDLAKALDAVVVKAWQFVYFTKLAAGVTGSWATGVNGNQYSASASSAVRIIEQKTRLSFRLPTSTMRTKNTPRLVEPKDGDVVVALGKPMFIGDQYYNIENSRQSLGASILHSGVQHLNFAATLTNPAEYKTGVNGAIAKTLEGLVGTALGR